MRVTSAEAFERETDTDNTTREYRRFRDAEGIPVHTGLAVGDVGDLETGPWERTGERGAFVNLYGCEGVNDVHLHELTPGGGTRQQHHLYDQVVFVLEGNGFTEVGEGAGAVTFEWSRSSLFHLPTAVPYRHANAADAPAKLVAMTPLPQLLTMYQDEALLVTPPDAIKRSLDDGYYSTDASLVEGEAGRKVWTANFVPDTRRFDRLSSLPSRGAGGATVLFQFPRTSLWAHISEFPPGRYKKGHRHHPGAVINILEGEGYSLVWNDALDEKIRIDWGRGSLLAPPARWYHQHFNTGADPVRYLPLHAPELGTLQRNAMFDRTRPENQIEYPDEDPAIRELYREELESRGAPFRMPAACYEDPGYAFQDGVA